MVKVMFYAEDGSHKVFTCKFRSERMANNFIEDWQYFGGFTRFSADIWGDTNQRLPIIPCNFKGFKQVYNTLYL